MSATTFRWLGREADVMRRVRVCFDDAGEAQVRHLREVGLREARTVPDLFTGEALGRLIRDEQADCILCCHGSVSLSYDCAANVADLVSELDRDFGPDGWAMVGNAGIEALSLRSVRLRYDKRLAVVPSPCGPLPAVGIDPHLVLLNAAALRRAGIRPPQDSRWDAVVHMALLIRSWERGLACLLDSRLYAHHDSFPLRRRAALRQARARFPKYPADELLLDRFGVPGIGRKGDGRGFHEHVLAAMRAAFPDRPARTVAILTRTRLDRPRYLRRLLRSVRAAQEQGPEKTRFQVVLSVNNVPPDVDRSGTLNMLRDAFGELDIVVVDGDHGPLSMFPRVRAIASALDALPRGPEDYVWIVDDDDYLLAENTRFLDLMLMGRRVVVADALVFKEEWEETGQNDVPVRSILQSRFDGARYHEILNGYNFIPVCGVLFPCSVLRAMFERYRLRGNYFEDYMLLTAAMLTSPSRHYPVALTGISMHGDNTVLERDKIRWNHSYATFLGELARCGPLPNCCHEYVAAVNIWFQERQLAKEILARLPMAEQGARVAGRFLDWLARWRRS